MNMTINFGLIVQDYFLRNNSVVKIKSTSAVKEELYEYL